MSSLLTDIRGRMNRFAMMAKLTAGIGLLLGLIAFMAQSLPPTVLEQSEKRALARKAASNAAVAAYNMAPALLLGDTLAAKTSLLGFEQDEDLEYIVVGDSSERVFFTFRGASAGEVPVTLWGSGDNALGDGDVPELALRRAERPRHRSVMVGLSLRPLNAEIARSRFLISTVSSGMFCLGFLIVLIISAITTGLWRDCEDCQADCLRGPQPAGGSAVARRDGRPCAVLQHHDRPGRVGL